MNRGSIHSAMSELQHPEDEGVDLALGPGTSRIREGTQL